MNFVHVEPDETPLPCVTLVGMAGAGKSTLGRLLAERLGWEQLDTDRLLESYYGQPLQAILDRYGLEEFLRIEGHLVSELSLNRMVISTGGSVIYSDAAVARLKQLGPVVMLDVSEATFKERVGDGADRGLAIAPGIGMGDLYNERQPLYRAAADLTVRTDRDDPATCVDRILQHLDLP